MDGARLTAAVILVALFLPACVEENASPAGHEGAQKSRELEILAFDQQGGREVGRNETLVLRFSESLDPASVGPGSIRVVSRRGSREQPVTVTVEGDRVLLRPPHPFGFDPRTRYWVIAEGFPSLRAARSLVGRPLARRYRAIFTTSRFYGPDFVPPVSEAVELLEEPGGSFSVQIRFSEAIDPRSVELGVTLKITSIDDGSEISGRIIPDRRAEFFRFLPANSGQSGIRVRLTSGIMDLAGNPLHVEEGQESVFSLSAVPEVASHSEIVEEFTSTRMMDAGETTALWNGPISPGVLRGDRRTTTLRFEGDPRLPETHLPIGSEKIRIRMLLRREELGPPRELTGLLFSTIPSGPAAADYQGLRVEVTPTRRERLEQRGLDIEPPMILYDQATFRIDPGNREQISVPFTRFFSYDGDSNLLLEIHLGAGDHSNFFRARRSRSGTAVVLRGGKATLLRPLITLKSFSRLPTATSRFYDTGCESPEYFEPVVHPEDMPRNIRMDLLFQGATLLGEAGRPADPESTSDWVDDVRLLSGCRYLRFRVTFTGVNLTKEAPELDDLRIPFRMR